MRGCRSDGVVLSVLAPNLAEVRGDVDRRRLDLGTRVPGHDLVWYGSGQVTTFAGGNIGQANSISDNYRVVGSYTPGGYQVAYTGTSANTWELPGLPPNYSNQAGAIDGNFSAQRSVGCTDSMSVVGR
ncbi:MAG: hypothetical protein ACT4P7_21535 [Gemmatimonadaceae bacterium]